VAKAQLEDNVKISL